MVSPSINVPSTSSVSHSVLVEGVMLMDVMPWPLWLASVTETVCSCSSPHPDSASSTSTSASSRQSFFFICFLLHIPEIDFERCGGEKHRKAPPYTLSVPWGAEKEQ